MNILSYAKRIFKKIVKAKQLPYTSDDPMYERYSIGVGTYGYPEIFTFGVDGDLEIGNYCSIARNVKIFLGGNHHSDWVTTFPFAMEFPDDASIKQNQYTNGNVIIGNDVWIGYGAIIMSGVKIGDGAVIGAASIVTRDVDAYSIVAGNPAKFIRFRFTDDQIAALEQISWWNWSHDRIKDALPLLLSEDIHGFIEKYK